MWIALGILAGLAALIILVAALPVYILLDTDETGKLQLRCRFLGKTLGNRPAPNNNRLTEAVKKITGIHRLNLDQLKATAAKGDLLSTVTDSVSVIRDLLHHLFSLFSFSVITVLHVRIVCAREDAAQTAIDCGKCYAILSPLLGWLHGITTVKPKGEQIMILPDYTGNRASYRLKIKLRSRIFRIVGALLRVIADERKRKTTKV